MEISIRGRPQAFVEQMLKVGRFGSADEAVEAAVQSAAQRDAANTALRATIQASLAEGGSGTEEELEVELAATAARLRDEGF